MRAIEVRLTLPFMSAFRPALEFKANDLRSYNSASMADGFIKLYTRSFGEEFEK